MQLNFLEKHKQAFIGNTHFKLAPDTAELTVKANDGSDDAGVDETAADQIQIHRLGAAVPKFL